MKELMDLRFWMNESRDHLRHSFFKESVQFLGQTYHRATWTFEESGGITGFGFSTDSNLAMTKAMVESIERLVVRSLKSGTTNGIAAHFFPEAAARSAVLELIERDSYLGHWYGNISPQYLKSIPSELGEISLYKLHSTIPDIFVSMAVIRFKDGHIIGLGSSEIEEESLLKATEEAGAITLGALKSEITPLTLKEFELRNSPAPMDHIRWGLSAEAGAIVEEWLKGKSASPVHMNSAPIVTEIHWPLSVSAPPIKFMKASGNGFLQLFFGMPSPGRVELSSLNRWNSRTILLPHTFG